MIFNKRAVSDKLIPNLLLMYLLSFDIGKLLSLLGFEPTLLLTIFSIYSNREVLGSNPIYTHCLKMTQNVAFELLNFGIFRQFVSY